MTRIFYIDSFLIELMLTIVNGPTQSMRWWCMMMHTNTHTTPDTGRESISSSFHLLAIFIQGLYVAANKSLKIT